MKRISWLRSKSDLMFSYMEMLVVLAAVFLANPDQKSVMIGLLPFFLGIMLRVWSLGYQPIGKRLGDVGPYRFVRYPLVLSTLLILIGIVFAARSFPLAILVLLFVAVETYLKVRWQVVEGHGKEDVSFPKYVALVPTMIPNLVPYPQSGSEKFNWRLVFHEQHRIWVQSLLVQLLTFVWFALVLLEPVWGRFSWITGILFSLIIGWQFFASRDLWKQVAE